VRDAIDRAIFLARPGEKSPEAEPILRIAVIRPLACRETAELTSAISPNPPFVTTSFDHLYVFGLWTKKAVDKKSLRAKKP
jgi:hypothetical protein